MIFEVGLFPILFLTLLLVSLATPPPLKAEEAKCSTCAPKTNEQEDFWKSFANSTSWLLMPRGDLTPSSWFAEKMHQGLLVWDRFRAEHGSPSAAYEVGRALYFGLGTRSDEIEGLRWLLKAADQGDPMSRYTIAAIGFCRYAPKPVLPGKPFTKKSYAGLPEEIRKRFTEEQCRVWLAEAVEAGYPKAIRLRAFVPEQEPSSEMETLKTKLFWLEKAQEAGDPYAKLCRWNLLEYKPPKRTFILPDLVWTAWGTP